MQQPFFLFVLPAILLLPHNTDAHPPFHSAANNATLLVSTPRPSSAIRPNKTDTIPDDGGKPASFKTYSNYDFVPGNTIIFEDNFAGDADGEFPTHWELQNGQGVINKIGTQPAMLITEGNYGWIVSPYCKEKIPGNRMDHRV